MKKLVIILLVLAAAYAGYSGLQSRKMQTDLLKKEVAALEAQNEELVARSKLAENQAQAQRSEHAQKRNADLQLKLNAENVKLADFQKRKALLTSAMNDPALASSLTEVESEIKEKNDAIQSLQLQLSSNQDYEKNVDHSGEEAKQLQNLSKTQAIADTNAKIRAQEELIRTTQQTIRAKRQSGTVETLNEVPTLQASLVQMRNDLVALRASKDQINQANAVQNVQIHQQIGQEKSSIQSSVQEIRAQIGQLRGEVKALEAQKGGASKSVEVIRKQSAYIDQQISASKTEITRIQNLMKED